MEDPKADTGPADLDDMQRQAAAQAKALLERDLRAAWAARDFTLAYQPQVDLDTYRVTTFEALLRWRHPVRGDVPPSDFVPLAEDIGLIGEIGQWVLERACLDAAAWPADVVVAVNVSSIQLQDAGLPAMVAAVLESSGLPPSRLELEVTETARMPDDPASLAVLQTLRHSGVGIVMDDFDIGYSALGYLLNFPFNKIKIDRSFTEKIPRDEHRHEIAITIVRAIVDLCKKLDIACLAEGVETPEQLAVLTHADCTAIQGYLVGRPAPVADVPRALRDIPALLRTMDIGGRIAAAVPHRLPTDLIPFLQIAETANDVIIVTTPDLMPPGPVITYVNPAFTRLTGYTSVEAIGRTPRILQGPGTSRTTLDVIFTELRGGRPVHEKILNYAKSGAPYWLDLQIVPLHDLSGKLTHFAAIERDVTMDKRRLDELEHLADRDTLTGIPNRRAFLHALASECGAGSADDVLAANQKGPCLAFIDVDHFKRINDEKGHAVGDAVLCGLADCLTENIRRLDIVGRIGGEEFAVCMPGVAIQDAAALADRLRGAIEGAGLATPTGPVQITVSIGIACFDAGETVTALMQRADAAMYVAKRDGRNRVRTRDVAATR